MVTLAMPRFVSYIMAAMSCVQAIAAISEEMQNTLDQHNVYRCMHGVPLLEWDEDIAANAQGFADEGMYTHSPKNERVINGEQCGENIAYSSTLSGAMAVTMWYSEIEYTEPYGTADRMRDTVPEGMTIGHYTQVVWNDTTKLGCGKAKLKYGEGDFIVCQYAPVGNVAYDPVESAIIGHPVTGFPGNVFAPIKTAAECGSKKVEDIAIPQSCTPSTPLPHGSLCSYGWQCESTFCCPMLRVCLLRSGSSVSSADLSRLVVDEYKSDVISSVLRSGGTCKDALFSSDTCLQTKEGKPLRTWNQSQCGCTDFYMQKYSSCSWVSLNKGVTCDCSTSSCTVTTCTTTSTNAPSNTNSDSAGTSTTGSADTASNASSSTEAPTVVNAEAIMPSQVKMTMVVQNVNFDDLANNTTVMDTFKTNVKVAVAAEAGADVLPQHVDVVVSAGSVKVETTITPPAGVNVTALSTSLGSSSNSLTTAVVDKIKEDPALVAMASGSISAAVTVAPAAVPAATTTTVSYDHTSDAFRATCGLLGLLSLLFLQILE